MADQPRDDRDQETAQLFRGTAARSEVFESLDSIASLDEPEPTTPTAEREPVDATTDGAPDAAHGPVDEADRLDDSAEDPAAAVDARPAPLLGRVRSELVAFVPPEGPSTRRRRVLTAAAVALAIVGTFLVIFPFDVGAGGVTAQCGPPLFEVVVPADAAFDVPENTLCGPPA